jgi:hypothetical protein
VPTVSPPLNAHEPLVDKDGMIRRPFYKWLTSLRERHDLSPQLETAVVTLTGQTAAIGTTAIPSGVLSAGLYRVTTFLRVTTPAGSSSSVQVTLHFTSGGDSCTLALTALTSNLDTAPVSDTRLLKIDSGPVSYSAAYASNPAAAMAFELSVVLERVSA